MKYFAIINEEQKGPFELSELPAAGVTPDTYVWCRGMSDWQPAGEVADICRYYRNRLFDLMHPQPEYKESDDEREEREQQEFEEVLEQVPIKFRHIVRKSGQMPGDPIEQEEDTETPPPPYLLAISIIVTIFCPLAMVAIYYSFQASRAWQESKRSGSKSSNKLYTDEERANYRKLAHDYARSAKMWIGISFFLGIIMYAFFAHKS